MLEAVGLLLFTRRGRLALALSLVFLSLAPLGAGPYFGGASQPARAAAEVSWGSGTPAELSRQVGKLRAQLSLERKRHAQRLAAARASRAGAGSFTPALNRQITHALARNLYGWTGAQATALDVLWGRKESGYNHRALNPSSGACGIPQSLPCSKMASFGPDYRTNPVPQILWGLRYIKQRYGSPARAVAFHNRNNFY